ncbi:hypothetical protein [Sphingobacterium sp.]|uniref:hypothetical protein n=1 Tax=Sphingobacterium sp. TaxID=341027 RepID=UPI0031E27280
MRYIKLFMSVIVALSFCSCKKEKPFDYKLNDYSIAKVTCQASSSVLVADDLSELDLNVKIYIENGTYTDIDSVERTAYREVPKERWRDHEIKFFLADGTPVSSPFKIASSAVDKLQFYATVDGIRSTKSVAAHLSEFPPFGSKVTPIAPQNEPSFFEVKVKEPLAVGSVKKIPVIFHVINPKRYEDAYQRLDEAVLYDMINQWNNVFGRKNDRSPNGGNPNIEFVPAIKDPAGRLLDRPGIHKVILTDAQVTTFEASPLSHIWSNTSTFYWNCDRYLNVWISYNSSKLPTTVWQNYIKKSMPLVFPQGVWSNVAFSLPPDYQGAVKQLNETELNAWKLNPGGAAGIGELEQVGLLFDSSLLTIKDRVNVVQPMGAFLGLIPNAPLLSTANYLLPPTGSVRKWYDDLCADTWQYNLWYATAENGGFEPAGMGSPTAKYGQITGSPQVYTSSNIMEVGSNCTSISLQQTARINWVLENAPGRQSWKNPSALAR